MNAVREFVVMMLVLVLIFVVVGFGAWSAESLLKAYDKKLYQERHCVLDQGTVGPTLYCN